MSDDVQGLRERLAAVKAEREAVERARSALDNRLSPREAAPPPLARCESAPARPVLPPDLRESREVIIRSPGRPQSPRASSVSPLQSPRGAGRTPPLSRVPPPGAVSAIPPAAASPRLSSPRLSSPHVATPPMSPRSLAQPVIDEILRTERTYVADLGLVLRHFCQPMQQRGLVSPEMATQLFGNLDRLLALHQQLLAELSAEATKPFEAQNWGRIFKTHVREFQVEYRVFTKNEKEARKQRNALERDPAVKAFLAQAFKHPDVHHTTLNSYLIKPVQRYPLLLRELQKAFEGMGIRNDAASTDLFESMNAIGDVLERANDYMATIRPQKAAAPPPPVDCCNFCNKPVPANQRRVEDSLVFHVGLCYVKFLAQMTELTFSKPEVEGTDSLDSILYRVEEEQQRARQLAKAPRDQSDEDEIDDNP